MTITFEPNSLPGSPNLNQIRNVDGVTWHQFRSTLSPKYAQAYFEIAFCYTMVVAGLAILGVAGAGGIFAFALSGLVAAWTGFWAASLLLFFHEAAHRNLARKPSLNDFIANGLVGLWFGQDIKSYRSVHWKHHTHFGHAGDSEVSYRHAPTILFFLSALTGIHALRVLLARRRAALGKRKGRVNASVIFRSLSAHGSVLGLLLILECYPSIVAWITGFMVFFPFFFSVRQILEHRDPLFPNGVDEELQGIGATNRLFGKDPISRVIGGAGFNRHLLHHWDPTISYTNFDQMEAFLQDSPLQSALTEARTTYWQTWRMLGFQKT